MAQEIIELTSTSSSLIYQNSGALPVNVYTPILTYQVPLQAGWYLPANPKLLMTIVNSASAQLPANASFILAYQRPTDKLPTDLGSEVLYGFYLTHSIGDQASANYDSQTRMSLYAPKSFIQNTLLQVLIKVPAAFTIDWSASSFYLQYITQVDSTS